MHTFTILVTLFALFSSIFADSITVKNRGPQQKKVCFTPGCKVPDTAHPGVCLQYYTWYSSYLLNGCTNSVTTMIEPDWNGNVRTVWPWEDCGKAEVLAEITFDGPWTSNKVWYDISAIVSTESDQVHRTFPRDDNEPATWAGCFPTFPCDNAYLWWGDNKTKAVTGLRDMVVTTGDYTCNLL